MPSDYTMLRNIALHTKGACGGMTGVAGWRVLALGVGVSLATAPAPGATQAIDAAAIPQVAHDDCELHVWPGSALRSTYYGWFHGGIVDGAVQGREGYRRLPEEPLSTQRQFAVMQASDLPALLGLPGFKTVFHAHALDSAKLRTTPGRYTAEGGPCHAELAIDDVFYQEDVFSGRFLKVIIRFKRFEGGAMPSRTFGSIIQEKLTQFPPTRPDDDPRPALDELSSAFASGLRDFGKALNASPRKKK